MYKRLIFLGVAQSDSVPDLDSGGRRFKSCLPDHFRRHSLVARTIDCRSIGMGSIPIDGAKLKMAEGLGLEPRFHVPKTCVLPLDDPSKACEAGRDSCLWLLPSPTVKFGHSSAWIDPQCVSPMAHE